MRDEGGIASGILLAMIGVWLVLRTVTTPAGGKNLAQIILGLGSGSSSSSSAAQSLTTAQAQKLVGSAPSLADIGKQSSGPSQTTPNIGTLEGNAGAIVATAPPLRPVPPAIPGLSAIAGGGLNPLPLG